MSETNEKVVPIETFEPQPSTRRLPWPMPGYLTLKRLPPPKTAGGLIIPDSAHEKNQVCEVFLTHPENKDGLIPGNLVLTQKYIGHEVKIDDEDYIICKSNEILARVK